MNPIYILLIVVGCVAVVFLGVYILMPLAIKKGLNVSGAISTTTSVLDTAGTVIDGVQLILPNNTTLELIDKIIGWAREAASAAEQMYKAAQIAKDERNATAIKLVYECLAVAGVERTEKIDSIVVGMIEAGVFALPETGEQEAA